MSTASPPDVWLSAGEWCLAAHQLKIHGLRKHAYPFDWSFHSLDHVTLALNDDLPLQAIFDGDTAGPRVDHEEHYVMTFPHRELMRDFPDIVARWKTLLEQARAGEIRVRWLYVTRENDPNVQEKLKRFMAAVPFQNYHVLHVHYHTWKDDDDAEKVNRIECETPHLCHEHLTEVKAYISHAWDGDNWNARDHPGLWDQIFDQCAQ